LDNLDYLFAAFATVWAAVFIYIILLAQKQRRLQQEMDRLEKRFARKDDEPA